MWRCINKAQWHPEKKIDWKNKKISEKKENSNGYIFEFTNGKINILGYGKDEGFALRQAKTALS